MTSRIKFLISLGNLIKNGAVKTVKQAMDFAEQQFGKIDKSFTDDIINVFKKEGKTKKGDVVPIKKQEGIRYRKPEEFATRKEYERYLDEVLGPPDDVFGSPLKDDLLKEWDKVNAKNVTPDIKKVIDEKEGDDFIDFVRKSGDEEGANKIQKEVDRLNKAIEDANKRVANEKGLTDSPLDDLERILKGEDPPAPTDKEMTERALAELTKKKSLGTMSQEAMIRSAVREFLSRRLKDGTLTIPDAGDRDAILRFTQGADPIDIFRKAYGEDAIKGVSEIQYDYGDMLQGTKTFDELGDMFEKLFYRESQGGLMYNTKPKPVKDYGFDPGLMSLEETEKMLRKDLKEKEILENFDVTDRTKNADGGLINILKL